MRGFEDAIAELEHAEDARAFVVGHGRHHRGRLGLCSTGDHIVAQHAALRRHAALLQLGLCPRFGIDVTFVDGTEPGAFAAAVRPGKTQLVFAETPANPKLAIVDLDELGAYQGPDDRRRFDVRDAAGRSARSMHGVDLVVHSATKAIAGHNDATLGVVAGSGRVGAMAVGLRGAARRERFAVRRMNGLRGLRTLGVRLERQQHRTGERSWPTSSKAHPHVDSVSYPGLASHPQQTWPSARWTSAGVAASPST